MAACFRIFRIVDGFHLFYLSFRIVGNNQLHRIEHSGYTCGTGVQVFTNGTFQQGKFIQGIVGGISDLVDEFADRFRGITTTTECTDSRHTGIVPTIDQLLFYQRKQVTLTHQCITQIQLVELGLTGTVVVQIFTFFQPVDEQVV